MNNRWVVVGAGVILQVILGGIYAWSVFVNPLMASYGINKTQTGIIFGLTIGTFAIAMIFAGKLLASKGPKVTAGIGAVLFTLGYIIASYSQGDVVLLMLCLGVIVGAGVGFGYVCPLVVGIKWFPNNKGAISGISVAGFGVGSVVVSILANKLIANGTDVLMIFRHIGYVLGSILFVCSMLLAYPPGMPKSIASDNDFNLKEILASKSYILLMLSMLAGTFGGLLVIGNLKPIVFSSGLPDHWATYCISFFALGNTLGRVMWGQIYDKIGFLAIPVSLVTLAIGLLLFAIPSSIIAAIAASIISGLGYSASFVLYAANVADRYGVDKFARVYPLLFIAYGISGIAGPSTGGWLAEVNDNYVLPIIIGASFAVLMTLVLGFNKATIKEEAGT